MEYTYNTFQSDDEELIFGNKHDTNPDNKWIGIEVERRVRVAGKSGEISLSIDLKHFWLTTDAGSWNVKVADVVYDPDNEVVRIGYWSNWNHIYNHVVLHLTGADPWVMQLFYRYRPEPIAPNPDDMYLLKLRF
jgi:hypothetical protein